MTTDTPEKPKKHSFWNPLHPLETPEEMLIAAKSGVWVCGFLAVSYVLQLAFIYGTGKDTFGTEGGLTTLISDTIGIALAAFLAWRIWARQGFWSAAFVGFWFAVELFFKVEAIASGQQRTNIGWIIMFAALTVTSIVSVRGSWKLRALRRSAPQP
jgi:hypothetical protein